MDFVRKLGKGETTIDGSEVKDQSVDTWAEEFAGKEADTDEMGYWGQLEKEWQELAK